MSGEAALGRILGVAILDDHRLALTWDDMVTGELNLSQVEEAPDLLAAVTQNARLGDVEIVPDRWSLAWPNGIDFGAEQLRRWAGQQGRLRSAETGEALLRLGSF